MQACEVLVTSLKGLIQTRGGALLRTSGSGPVLPRQRREKASQGSLSPPSTEEPLPLGQARLLAAGEHASVFAWGAGVAAARKALDRLSGMSIDLIDLRCLSPLDTRLLGESVRKTGRPIAVNDPGNVLSAAVEHAFLRLESPPVNAPADPSAIADLIQGSVHY